MELGLVNLTGRRFDQVIALFADGLPTGYQRRAVIVFFITSYFTSSSPPMDASEGRGPGPPFAPGGSVRQLLHPFQLAFGIDRMQGACRPNQNARQPQRVLRMAGEKGLREGASASGFISNSCQKCPGVISC